MPGADRVTALPEEEAGQPLLPRRADDQVRIRLALCVEVLGDVLDVQHLRDVLHRRSLMGMLVKQGPDSVDDLTTTAIADGHIDENAVDIRGRLRRLLEHARCAIGEQVEGTDGVDTPATRLR